MASSLSSGLSPSLLHQQDSPPFSYIPTTDSRVMAIQIDNQLTQYSTIANTPGQGQGMLGCTQV
jgi:hypothetical protein